MKKNISSLRSAGSLTRAVRQDKRILPTEKLQAKRGKSYRDRGRPVRTDAFIRAGNGRSGFVVLNEFGYILQGQ